MQAFINLEESIIIFLQQFCSEPVIAFLKVITELGDEIAVIAVLSFIYWCYDKKMGMKLVFYISCANIFYPMLKNLVKRPRPYMNNEKIRCIKPYKEGDIYDIALQGYSFPSGHMSNSACIYGPIYLKYKNPILRVILVVIIVLVGLSRICLGVHHPSDVLVGLAVGGASCWIYEKSVQKFGKRIVYPVLAIFGATGFLFCKSGDFYTGYGMLLGAIAAEAFEGKYVNFEDTKSLPERIIRMIGGLIVFLLIYKGSKLPFSAEFLDSKTFLAFFVRSIRYFLIVFCTIGVYPLCFKLIHFRCHRVTGDGSN